MVEDKRARLQEWLQRGKARLHPLAHTQRELWEAAPFPAEDVSNHIGALIFVRGPATPGTLRSALELVVARQEVLRLAIVPGKSQPVQVIRDSAPPALRFRDLAVPDNLAIEAISEELFREPFDHSRGPLYRIEVMRRAADDHVLALSIHHAIADGWSLGVLFQDFWAAYANILLGRETALPPVALSFSRWAADEREFWTSSEVASRATFWKARLAGAQRVLGANPGADAKRQRLVSRIPGDPARRAREVARQTSTTLYSTLLAAFQLTLSEWIGADDILVGTPVANRTRQAVRETIGSFASIVPLRGRIDRGHSFSDHVKSVHQDTIESFAHAMPFAELVAALGEPIVRGRNPVFDVRFAFQNHPVPDVSLPGMSVRFELLSTGAARFDLGCEITEDDDALEVVWLFRPDLLKANDVAELDRLFGATLLRSCGAAMAMPGGALLKKEVAQVRLDDDEIEIPGVERANFSGFDAWQFP